MRHMTTLYVEPSNGHWVVRRDDATRPVSEHHEAGAASRAAFAQARAGGATHVQVRDRYNRSRTFATPVRETAAQARDEPAPGDAGAASEPEPDRATAGWAGCLRPL